MNNPTSDFDIKFINDRYTFNMKPLITQAVDQFHRKVEQLCEADFSEAARKLGYIKLEPGQVVVDAADVESLTEFFSGFCPPVWIEQACHRITDAIMEARDAEI